MIGEWIRKGLMGTGILTIALIVLGAMIGSEDDAGMYYDNQGGGSLHSADTFTDDSAYYDDAFAGDAYYGEPSYSNPYLNRYTGQGSYNGEYGTAYQNDPNGYYDQQGAYEYNTRWGGGSQSSDGSWSHYSGLAGGAVGGTSDGCIYTSVAGGWSNC